MTHRCFQCKQKFPTSTQLVAHMKDVHSSFVEDAKQKIDRAKESSAVCPFCKKDCHTRKLLMVHLEYEHKDHDDTPEEPQVKLIKLSEEQKKLFMDQIPAGKRISDENPFLVQTILKSMETDGTKGADCKLKLTNATALKLPEKRYKCFWCEISFRKRGKLMDHIDMFHKANKHQNEIEAEILQGCGSSVNVSVHVKPSSCSSQECRAPQTTSLKSNAKFAVTATLSKETENQVCNFQLIGSILEKSAPRKNASEFQENTYKFFRGKTQNPLVGSKKIPSTGSSKAQKIPSSSPSSSSGTSAIPSLTKVSDLSIHMPGSPLSTFLTSFTSDPITCIASQQRAQLFHRRHSLAGTQIPFLFSPNDNFTNNQPAVLDNHRSRLSAPHFRPQYMHHLSNLSTVTELPLDLTTTRLLNYSGTVKHDTTT